MPKSIPEDCFQRGNAPAADSQAMFPNGWTRIDNDLRKARLGAYPKLLFTILRTYTDARGTCWPSFQTLADDMEVSRSTVIRAMKKLEDEGLVRKARLVSEKGSLTSNKYWVAESLRDYVPSEGWCLSDTRVVSERTSNKNQLTRPLQDFNSCPYVRNAREAETTENLNPEPECEESPSPVAGSPLRGGREEEDRVQRVHAWKVWPVVEGLVCVPGFWPSESVFMPLPDWSEAKVLFEGRFPASPVEALDGLPVADEVPVMPVDVLGADWRERASASRSGSPAEPVAPGVVSGSGGAWGDDVPLPAPKHVYGSGPVPSEKPAKGSVGGVEGSPVPSPTPDVPKRPRKPSWNWMQGAPKRWADDGKPTTIPPTFTPSPRHVAFAEAWGLDVDSICKAFVAKHMREGTLVQCWDLHFAELLEMKHLDKEAAEREAERLRPELEAAEAARQARRRELSERLEAQTAGAVPPTAEFLALRPMIEAIRAKYGMKPKPKGEHYGWRADSHTGWESDRGPGTEVRQQRDARLLVHAGLDAEETKPGDAAVGGRGDDVRPLRRVEADGGERRRVPGEGTQGGGDRTALGAELRARGTDPDLDQPGGGRDRPVPEVREGDRGEDDDAIDVAAELAAWRRIRDVQLAG